MADPQNKPSFLRKQWDDTIGNVKYDLFQTYGSPILRIVFVSLFGWSGVAIKYYSTMNPGELIGWGMASVSVIGLIIIGCKGRPPKTENHNEDHGNTSILEPDIIVSILPDRGATPTLVSIINKSKSQDARIHASILYGILGNNSEKILCSHEIKFPPAPDSRMPDGRKMEWRTLPYDLPTSDRTIIAFAGVCDIMLAPEYIGYVAEIEMRDGSQIRSDPHYSKKQYGEILDRVECCTSEIDTILVKSEDLLNHHSTLPPDVQKSHPVDAPVLIPADPKLIQLCHIVAMDTPLNEFGGMATLLLSLNQQLEYFNKPEGKTASRMVKIREFTHAKIPKQTLMIKTQTDEWYASLMPPSLVPDKSEPLKKPI